MDIRKSKKSLRSRCANPECDQQFRHARSSRKWCSEACRKVVSRQSKRRAAVGALVRVLAAVAVKRQDAKAATDAQQARAMAKMESNLAAHLRKEAEQQAAEQQQVAEQERARPRTSHAARRPHHGHVRPRAHVPRNTAPTWPAAAVEVANPVTAMRDRD